MVAINSIPQQEVANGKGHNECERAKPTTLSKEVAKKPEPSIPGGASTILISLMLLNKKCLFLIENKQQIYNILKVNRLRD